MKKLIIILILLAGVVFTAGCTEEKENSPTNTQAVQVTKEEKNVTEVTSLEEINASLEQGPILVRIGSERCGSCKDMDPMLKELATEYGERATIISVNIDKSPELASYFVIGYVPDSTVIMNVKNGEYVYMKPDGNVTTDRFQARILGNPGEKDILKKVLNLALIQAEKDTSQ